MDQQAQRMAFLRILIAAAWADEQLSPQEIRTLSYYLQRLRISEADYEALRPILEHPVSSEQARALVQQELSHLSSGEEQRTLLAAVEDLLAADDRLLPAEEAFLRDLRRLTRDPPTAQVFISRLNSLWASLQPEVSAPAPQQPVRRFLQQRLLEYFRGRIALARAQSGQIADLETAVEDHQLYRLVLWAGLLGRVAGADRQLRAAERDQLVDILRGLGGLQEPDLQVVVATALDGSITGIDLKTLTGELMQVASAEETALLLDSLLLVAAADGRLHPSEVDVIRHVAQEAGFTAEAFHASLARCQRRMASGWN